MNVKTQHALSHEKDVAFVGKSSTGGKGGMDYP
jgi:hypothetical protein